MDSTIPSSETLQTPAAGLKVMHGPGWISAEQLRLHALELLESNVDLTVDFSGIESLDASTLQVLLALEMEQANKNLRLCITGISPELLRWFEYAGAKGLLLIESSERNSLEWN